MSIHRWISIAVSACPLLVGAQAAPRWRDVEVARQLHDSSPQRIQVRYNAGRVDVRASSDPLLYSMHLRYDENRSVPLHRYDAAQRTSSLGVEGTHGSSPHYSGGESGELRLVLPRTVPLDIDMELGATETSLDLGGMSVQSLRMENGGTDATLRFSQPNRVRMQTLDITAGVADFTARSLGNANADQIRLHGAVGSFDLDFSGAWTHDVALDSKVFVGGLTLRVPETVGIRIEVQKLATSFRTAGLVKRGDAWYSANFDSAPFKLNVHAENMIGVIEIKDTRE